jgi:hypothetical protein
MVMFISSLARRYCLMPFTCLAARFPNRFLPKAQYISIFAFVLLEKCSSESDSEWESSRAGAAIFLSQQLHVNHAGPSALAT